MAQLRDDPWKLVYDDYRPEEEGLREALCALGNGRFVTRGACADSAADGVHYPGTYLAGGYNRLASHVGDRLTVNEDLVNLPNWLPLSFRPAGGTWYRIDDVDVLEYRLVLDLRPGILTRSVRVRDRDGRTTRILERRLVSMADRHLAATETTIVPEDWGGPVEIRSMIDGTVRNAGVPRYASLSTQHLQLVQVSGNRGRGDTVALVTETSSSRVRVAVAARTTVITPEARPVVQRRDELPGVVVHLSQFEVSPGEAFRVEKVVSLRTSRDRPSIEPLTDARRDVELAPRFDRLEVAHTKAWRRIWDRCRLELHGDAAEASLICNVHLFHLNQTISDHTVDLDAGVPARGWHGEAYRGHVFWDELFILPFLDYRFPERTRAALMYRYRRLGEARRAAAAEGYLGAMYPWQSAASGSEETQVVHLNPKSGRWLPDGSHVQRHINIAIAYNVWHHWLVTEEREFLIRYGAEMLLEIARFWSSIATLGNDGRWHIDGVMGPDEYHEAYVGSTEPGLRDNAYTNIMAAWVLRRAIDVLELLPVSRRNDLRDLLDLSDDELERWREQGQRMYVPINADGIIVQFEGWDELPEFAWDDYRARYKDIARLDRILEAEGDSPNNYRLSKQADALMALYVLGPEQLTALLADLGYPLDDERLQANIDYHLARTSHGSTLSRVVHSWLLAQSDRLRSWELFLESLESDVSDIQGGTTGEGIHLGAMVGTVDLVQRGFSGMVPTVEGLRFGPRLPQELSMLVFRIRFRSLWTLVVSVGHERLEVEAPSGPPGSIQIEVGDHAAPLFAGQKVAFDLAAPST